MRSAARIWIVGCALLIAGVAMILVGARSSEAEVAMALSSTGAALAASGITTVLVKLPWEESHRDES